MENKFVTQNGVPTLVVNDPSKLGEFELIDVRRPDEFNGELGHIHGAKLVTLGEELDAYLQKADKHKTTLFICRSGARSGRSTMQAMELGFDKVYNMEGGMIYWNEKNFPVERN